MPPFVPSSEQRAQVEAMIGYGLTYPEVAALVINPRTGKCISKATLQKHFAIELQSGRAKVKARVTQSLFKKAISDNHPQAAICAMFIAKCKFGWRHADRDEAQRAPLEIGPTSTLDECSSAGARVIEAIAARRITEDHGAKLMMAIRQQVEHLVGFNLARDVAALKAEMAVEDSEEG